MEIICGCHPHRCGYDPHLTIFGQHVTDHHDHIWATSVSRGLEPHVVEGVGELSGGGNVEVALGETEHDKQNLKIR